MWNVTNGEKASVRLLAHERREGKNQCTFNVHNFDLVSYFARIHCFGMCSDVFTAWQRWYLSYEQIKSAETRGNCTERERNAHTYMHAYVCVLFMTEFSSSSNFPFLSLGLKNKTPFDASWCCWCFVFHVILCGVDSTTLLAAWILFVYECLAFFLSLSCSLSFIC